MRNALWVSAFAALFAAGCGDTAPPAKSALPRIVCTTGMVADLVQHTVGARAEVAILMGPGVDPHRYKVTPGDERLLRSADFVVFSGLRLEGRLSDALEARREKQPLASIADFLDPTKTLKEGDGAADPHAWFDVPLWSSALPGLADALAKWRPEFADEFRANARRHREELGKVDAELRAVLNAVPPARRVMVTSHDAFRYFSRAYGWEVMGAQGISTEDEADVRHINELVDVLVRRRLPALFVESTVSPRNMQALREGCQAKGHAVKIGGELYSDALGDAAGPAGTYAGMVKANAKTLAEALR